MEQSANQLYIFILNFPNLKIECIMFNKKRYMKNYFNKYYIKNREKLLKNNKRRYLKRRQLIVLYKLSKGCSICGYNKCANALEFHHPDDDKEFNIGNMKRGINKIKTEMEKCIVICANCHRELHAEPKKGGLYE